MVLYRCRLYYQLDSNELQNVGSTADIFAMSLPKNRIHISIHFLSFFVKSSKVKVSLCISIIHEGV